MTGYRQSVEKPLVINRTHVLSGQRNVNVAVQLLRIFGQEVISQCAREMNVAALNGLRQRIVNEQLADHPVCQYLLSDITRLEALYQQMIVNNVSSPPINCRFNSGSSVPALVRTISGVNHPPSLQSAFSIACTSFNTTLSSPESQEIPELRRQLSVNCDEASLRSAAQ